MKVARRRDRLRVFGAGPAVNLGFAAIFLAVFAMMVGATTINPGAHILGITPKSPADDAGLAAGATVISFDGKPVADWTQLTGFLNATHPGDKATLGMSDGRTLNATLTSFWLGGIATDAERQAITGNTTAGLQSKACQEALSPPARTGSECADRLTRRAFIGVTAYLPEYGGFLSNPLGSHGLNLVDLMVLPLAEVKGQEPFLSVFLPSFYETPFAAAWFWPLALMAFWLFWINLMVGLTNILPMVPLDGGHIFRDAVGGIVQRAKPRMEPERRERIVGYAAGAMSLLILAAFLLEIIGPHFINGIR